MDETTWTNLDNLRSEDRDAQNKAFYAVHGRHLRDQVESLMMDIGIIVFSRQVI